MHITQNKEIVNDSQYTQNNLVPLITVQYKSVDDQSLVSKMSLIDSFLILRKGTISYIEKRYPLRFNRPVTSVTCISNRMMDVREGRIVYSMHDDPTLLRRWFNQSNQLAFHVM